MVLPVSGCGCHQGRGGPLGPAGCSHHLCGSPTPRHPPGCGGGPALPLEPRASSLHPGSCRRAHVSCGAERPLLLWGSPQGTTPATVPAHLRDTPGPLPPNCLHWDCAPAYAQAALAVWRRQWHPTPVFLPGESHGQRSLVGCSLWGHRGLDTTGAT